MSSASHSTHQDEIEQLRLQVTKLSRELRVKESFLKKVTKSYETKDALSKTLAEANAQQQEYVDMLLQGCPSIMFLLDDEGHFVLSTRALIEAIGVPNFDYLRNRVADELFAHYLSEDNLQLLREGIQHVSQNADAARFEIAIDFSRSGASRNYSVEVRAVPKHKGALVVMVDITDFLRQKQRAEAASLAKSEFLATMSHEIRTPMNTIIGMAEMLSRAPLEQKEKNYLDNIHASAQSLLVIINDILDFSKIEAGKIELVDANFNICSMLDNILSIFSEMCRTKGLEMRYEIAECVPSHVYGDEVRLRQILTNLLSNAVKYTKEGLVTLKVECTEAKDLHLNLCFKVMDTGIGIREVDLKRLFAPFEQLDLRKNRNVVGTGLGLVIARNLCELMGGTMSVTSVYGEGTTFMVELPFGLPVVDEVVTERVAIPDFSAAKARVLVVDDMVTNLAVAEALLSTMAVVPDLAFSGEQALESVQQTEYDLVFMDHMMPVMDGLEATRRIRECGDHNAKVPIVALTASAISGMREMFLAHQFDDYLPKPIDIKELRRMLYTWLPSERIEVGEFDNQQQ